MFHFRCGTLLFFKTFLCLLLGLVEPAFAQSTSKPSFSRYGKIPLSFEINQGQANSSTRFLSHGIGYSLMLEDRDAVLILSNKEVRSVAQGASVRNSRENAAADVIRMQLIGSRGTVHPVGTAKLDGTVNYFRGTFSSQWHTAIPTYRKVKYSNVYSGVDLVYYGNQRHLEFDFEVAPNGKAESIQLRFAGTKKLSLDHGGNLSILGSRGRVSFHKPVIYQIDGEGKHFIDGEFVLTTADTVGFHVGDYDRTKALIIDPILSYSTYLGTTGAGYAITTDADGNAYITGSTGLDFPTTDGVPEQVSVSQNKGLNSAFVTKLNASGTALIYSTYLSGTGNDFGKTIAVDHEGNAYIAGSTNSTDFPTTPGAFQREDKAVAYATSFITKLNSTGTTIIYSTYLGGSHIKNPNQFTVPGTLDTPIFIGVNESGEAFVAGLSGATDFPTTAGCYQSVNNARATSTFLTRFNASGTALVYSTYLGGSGTEDPTGAFLDTSGNLYVAGATSSSDFPTTPNVLLRTSPGARGGWNGFITKMNPAGTAPLYSTYFYDAITAMAVDTSGETYVAGSTVFNSLPITPASFQSSVKPLSQNVFIAKLNSSASSLIYSTYLGGSKNDAGGTGEDYALSIALDPSDNAIVVGTTDSTDFPTTPGALSAQNTAWIESLGLGAYITKFNATGTALLYSTYFGGSGDPTYNQGDDITAIVADTSGNIYATGATNSTDFPVTADAFQPYPLGQGAFVAKFNGAEMTALPLTTTDVTADVNPQVSGDPVAFTATVRSNSGNPPSGTVGVSVNGNPWSVYSLDQTGTTTFSMTTLPAGSDTIVTYYLGDANNAPSTNYLNETVTPGSGRLPVTLVVTPSANPVLYGTPVTFDVSVIDLSKKGVPVGTLELTFSGFPVYSNRSLYTGILDSSGHIRFATKSLPIGTDKLFANFHALNANYADNSLPFTETVAQSAATSPIFSPPAGTYTGPQSVTITSLTANATIHYTFDGSTPTAASPAYSQPLTVPSSLTIRAVSSAADYADSPIASSAYTINPPPLAPAPSMMPPPGTYTSPQQIELSDALPDAKIYYTTDGSTPTIQSSLYTKSVFLNSTSTVQAVAVADGFSPSSITSAVYTINLPTPDFSVSVADASVTVSQTQPGKTFLKLVPTTGFTDSVSLSCSELSTGISCNFSPPTINAGKPDSLLTLSKTPSNSVYLHIPGSPPAYVAFAVFAIWCRPWNFRKRRFPGLFFALSSVLLLFGCGGDKVGSSSSHAQTVKLTIRAASGGTVHTIPLSVSLY
jgi:hypothetical protein